MLDCKRVLEGAKTELHVLDVKDVQPEKIQLHLSGCMVRFLQFLTDTLLLVGMGKVPYCK